MRWNSGGFRRGSLSFVLGGLVLKDSCQGMAQVVAQGGKGIAQKVIRDETNKFVAEPSFDAHVKLCRGAGPRAAEGVGGGGDRAAGDSVVGG